MKKNYFHLFVVIYLSISTLHAQSFKQKELKVNFPNGQANLAVDILLGNDNINGTIEVNISGTYVNQNSVGVIRKMFQVGLNPSNVVWHTPTTRIMEASGPLLDNIYVGNIVWDITLNQYKLTIYHTSPNGNPYSILLSQYSSDEARINNATIGQVYTAALIGNKRHNVSYDGSIDVNGTIHSKEVKVDLNGWADYVFKKDYDLPTLEEVERHIKNKGHLPDIPSEKEVLANGLSLGQSQKMLLQKIEELTLYSIEQNKQLKEQAERIKMLEELAGSQR